MVVSTDTYVALLDLYARYAHAVDANDGAAWIECWMPDAEFVPGVGRTTRGVPVVGHDALKAFATSRPDDYPRARILTVNHVFVGDDERVEGKAYALVTDVSGDRPRPSAHVVYHDVIVRSEDGRWRFASRRPVPDVEQYPDTV